MALPFLAVETSMAVALLYMSENVQEAGEARQFKSRSDPKSGESLKSGSHRPGKLA